MVYSGFHGTRRFLSPFGKLKLDLDLAAQDFELPPTALMYVFAKQKPILIKVLFAWGSVLSLSGSLSLWIALGVCLFLSRCVCLPLSLSPCLSRSTTRTKGRNSYSACHTGDALMLAVLHPRVGLIIRGRLHIRRSRQKRIRSSDRRLPCKNK